MLSLPLSAMEKYTQKYNTTTLTSLPDAIKKHFQHFIFDTLLKQTQIVARRPNSFSQTF